MPIELFKIYPNLETKIPALQLGTFPTPVVRLRGLEKKIGKEGIFCKQDSLSAVPYGGNKIRKLEFHLGEAVHSGYSRVVTFGCVGSNHALATVVSSQKVGLRCTLVLFPQPNAYSVRRNLLLDHQFCADMVFCRDFNSVNFQTLEGVPGISKESERTMVIPPGGSSPLGAVGYVNAAFELKQQIDGGVLPEPDYIFLPFGTMGTAAGLMLGCQACGITTRIIPVRVVIRTLANLNKCCRLFEDTAAFLNANDQQFPMLTMKKERFRINQEYFGAGYGYYSQDSVDAVRIVRESDGIELEGTYSGKALAALIDFCRKKENRSATILFWNTYTADTMKDRIADSDYHDLPRDFWWYFENDVQPLDHTLSARES